MQDDKNIDRDFLFGIINDYFSGDTFVADLAAITPRQRIETMQKLLAFVMPRLKAIEMEMNAKTSVEPASSSPTLLDLLELNQ